MSCPGWSGQKPQGSVSPVPGPGLPPAALPGGPLSPALPKGPARPWLPRPGGSRSLQGHCPSLASSTDTSGLLEGPMDESPWLWHRPGLATGPGPLDGGRLLWARSPAPPPHRLCCCAHLCPRPGPAPWLPPAASAARRGPGPLPLTRPVPLPWSPASRITSGGCA